MEDDPTCEPDKQRVKIRRMTSQNEKDWGNQAFSFCYYLILLYSQTLSLVSPPFTRNLSAESCLVVKVRAMNFYQRSFKLKQSIFCIKIDKTEANTVANAAIIGPAIFSGKVNLPH